MHSQNVDDECDFNNRQFKIIQSVDAKEKSPANAEDFPVAGSRPRSSGRKQRGGPSAARRLDSARDRISPPASALWPGI